MARVTVEDCLKKVSNRFTLVILVAKRVRQFLSGDKPLLDSENKQVVTALREVAAGKVHLNVPKDEMAKQLEDILTGKTSEDLLPKNDDN